MSLQASDHLLDLTPTGPFSTNIKYCTVFAEQYLELISDGQLYTEYLFEAYLTYRFLRGNVGKMVSLANEQEEKFYLKHVDNKGDHLLVNGHLNITEIINWQMARVAPAREACEAFLMTTEMNALCNGKVSLSTDDVALADKLRKKGMLNREKCMSGERAR